MGNLIEQNDERVYRQDDGEITAWLTDFVEKTELRHEGSRGYKKIFYLLVTIGCVYLALVFTVYR